VPMCGSVQGPPPCLGTPHEMISFASFG
jgi:hypothetical protein